MTPSADPHTPHAHTHDHGHSHDVARPGWRHYLPAAVSLLLLAAGMAADALIPAIFSGWLQLAWYLAAYLPVGFPTVMTGVRLLLKGDVFTEFTLMSIATIGAFFIGAYPEGVAVMLFYTIGEYFQEAAVSRARRSIKALLDIRPDTAAVLRGGALVTVAPGDVRVGETIRVRPGERVPLDGTLVSERASFNTAALTGESIPADLAAGAEVLAGMISGERPADILVTKPFGDSALARILALVQDATKRKAKTEQFIRRFARIYTPAVVFLALAITIVPAFVVEDYVLRDWLYRALIFLVISCPCALVISIPLGYFGGIGAASRRGILFKGSNFLDLMTRVNTVVMDKTGTLTEGIFRVQRVIAYEGMPEHEWLPLAAALEAGSTHPVARAVVSYAGYAPGTLEVTDHQEISGNGMKGTVAGKKVVAGNLKLMRQEGISVDGRVAEETGTIVAVAVDGQAAGYMIVADELRKDSRETIAALHRKGIATVMLSGDRQQVVDQVARELHIDHAYGELLPEDKVQRLLQLKATPGRTVAFVGDGINDAPVLAASDVGIAMGGLGSDAAVETADVVIQTDHPSKIVQAIGIGRATNRVVWQNITLAFAVKGIILLLGAGGLATMWEAVFADVGVALLAIMNASRVSGLRAEG